MGSISDQAIGFLSVSAMENDKTSTRTETSRLGERLKRGLQHTTTHQITVPLPVSQSRLHVVVQIMTPLFMSPVAKSVSQLHKKRYYFIDGVHILFIHRLSYLLCTYHAIVIRRSVSSLANVSQHVHTINQSTRSLSYLIHSFHASITTQLP